MGKTSSAGQWLISGEVKVLRHCVCFSVCLCISLRVDRLVWLSSFVKWSRCKRPYFAMGGTGSKEEVLQILASKEQQLKEEKTWWFLKKRLSILFILADPKQCFPVERWLGQRKVLSHLEEFEHTKKAMEDLDQNTRVPHLLIEIRSLGFVEIQGKNTGGIYERLDQWLKEHWKVEEKTIDFLEVCNDEAECGCCGYNTACKLRPMEEHHHLCDKSYTMGPMNKFTGVPQDPHRIYKARGFERERWESLPISRYYGENNMGKLTMQLAHFMTQECGWTLQICDAANLGYDGLLREQQMKFKAPHPLSMIAPLVMIELRKCRWEVGYIEVNGSNKDGIFEKLRDFFQSKWRVSDKETDPDYCDMKFGTLMFQTRGPNEENNMGQKTMELVDFMVKQCQWSMVTCNCGNFGQQDGKEREQQLIFRKDDFVQHGLDHIMIELRTAGFVEFNGLHDAQDLKPHLIKYFERQGFSEYRSILFNEKFCDLKMEAPEDWFHTFGVTSNLGKRTLQLAEFLGNHGWALALCNGGSFTPNPERREWILREQQVKFTRSTPEKVGCLGKINFGKVTVCGT